MSDDALIRRFRRVSLGYAQGPVLKDVNLEIVRGDYLGIVGPNGSGKTTLLLGLLGVKNPLEGTIEGPDVLRVGYVPQRSSLDEIYPLTVRDVVVMGRELMGARFNTPLDLASLLDSIGLTGLEDRRYRELSGGQKQRVLIGRALAVEPELLVLDEPTNGLDFFSERALMDLVDSLFAQGRTIVLVSHLLNLVANHAHSLALVGGGRVVTGSIDQLLTGENLGQMYDMSVIVANVEGQRVILSRARDSRDTEGDPC